MHRSHGGLCCLLDTEMSFFNTRGDTRTVSELDCIHDEVCHTRCSFSLSVQTIRHHSARTTVSVEARIYNQGGAIERS